MAAAAHAPAARRLLGLLGPLLAVACEGPAAPAAKTSAAAPAPPPAAAPAPAPTPGAAAVKAAAAPTLPAPEPSSVVVTLGGHAAAAATYACYDGALGINIYPFDAPAWRAAHGSRTVPRAASGSIVHIPLPAGKVVTGKTPIQAPPKATAARPLRASDQEAVLGHLLDDCRMRSARGSGGQITLTDVSGSDTTLLVRGAIDAQVVAPDGARGSIRGTFAARPCGNYSSPMQGPDVCPQLSPTVSQNGAFPAD